MTPTRAAAEETISHGQGQGQACIRPARFVITFDILFSFVFFLQNPSIVVGRECFVQFLHSV